MKFAEEIVTPAIEAMAKQVWEDSQQSLPEIARSSWEHGNPVTKQQLKQELLPLLMAGLEAIPDPRAAAWTEGLYAGLRKGYEDDNPYLDREE